MLTGEKPTESRWQSLARVLLVRAFFSPLTLMGAGLAWVGALSLGPRKDIPELWICLPAGLLLLWVTQAVLWWSTVSLPRRTVLRFVQDGKDLAFETKAHGSFICSIRDIGEVTEARSRNGRVSGWWIHIKSRGVVFLDAKTTHCRVLLNQLSSSANAKPNEA